MITDTEGRFKSLAEKYGYTFTRKQYEGHYAVLVYGANGGYELHFQKFTSGRARVKQRYTTLLAWDRLENVDAFLQELHSQCVVQTA